MTFPFSGFPKTMPATYLKDGEIGPCLQVGDNLLGCPVVRQVGRRRVLPLLQDADCALGLLHHSQDAVKHLVEAKIIMIDNDFNTSKEYNFILSIFSSLSRT